MRGARTEDQRGRASDCSTALRPPWLTQRGAPAHRFSTGESQTGQRWPGSSTHARLIPTRAHPCPKHCSKPKVAAAGGGGLTGLPVEGSSERGTSWLPQNLFSKWRLESLDPNWWNIEKKGYGNSKESSMCPWSRTGLDWNLSFVP